MTTTMAFSNKCPVCKQDEDVNSSGRFVGHAGKSGGNCPGSGKTMSEARSMSAELDAVDFARSTHCPYCTRSVVLHARTLGDHRTYGGVCDGSGRRVAEFDSMGRPVLEPKA